MNVASFKNEVFNVEFLMSCGAFAVVLLILSSLNK